MLKMRHKSDCALHNTPACEPKPCDCGGERHMLQAIETVIIKGERLLDAINHRERMAVPKSDYKAAIAVLNLSLCEKS